MAQVKQCDWCKEYSPNSEGLHLAYNWYRVGVVHRDKVIENLWICDKCAGAPDMPIRKFIAKVFIRLFGKQDR